MRQSSTLHANPPVLIPHQPVHCAERQDSCRQSEQLSCVSRADVENDQLANDGQHRDQDHGANLYNGEVPSCWPVVVVN